MDVITMSSVAAGTDLKRENLYSVSSASDKPGELCKVSGIISKRQQEMSVQIEHNQFVTTNRSAPVELPHYIRVFLARITRNRSSRRWKRRIKTKVVRTSL